MKRNFITAIAQANTEIPLQLTGSLFTQRMQAYYAQQPPPTLEARVTYACGTDPNHFQTAPVDKQGNFKVNQRLLGDWLVVHGYPNADDSAYAQINCIQQSGNQPLNISDPTLQAMPAIHANTTISSTQSVITNKRKSDETFDTIGKRVHAAHARKTPK